ncbi:MAG: putative membrane protein YqjE [Verrucomicrobiales bacterium]|jgi:uncharacterized membrane protein YqjE
MEPTSQNRLSKGDSEAQEEGSDDVEPAPSATERIAEFLRARLLLFQLELQDAIATFKHLAIWHGIAVLLAAMACFFLILGSAGMISRLFAISWDVLALVLGGIHGIAAFVFFMLIRRGKKQQPFSESLNQIEIDRQWLESKIEPPQS